MAERDDRLTTDDLAAGSRREEGGEAHVRDSAVGDETVAGELRGETRAQDRSEAEPLLAAGQTDDFRGRWEDIQTGFVDEPRRAVEQADALVAELMQRLADSFSQERQNLEAQWDRGDDVSTEDLRVALQRYRSFFGRLLST